ncbi:alcohol dehydrogenase [Penicillium longicatenatum]|uniref:alcohol dehydrogenase n=1 Tax=Penicillium longicatenatum TaxID=1561947 RepID=UPI002547B9C9|nr:alcohol dehydrogenase [Penicillium longicatenatum]KAJ5631071.1 alcohol dehydrogenase [Penicillium longicatenatum]
MFPAIPKTCKAIVLDGPKAPWALREVPVELKEGEILIKSLACGVCHSAILMTETQGFANFDPYYAKFGIWERPGLCGIHAGCILSEREES